MWKRTKPLATRDWAGGLPPELLSAVVDHLTPAARVRFAAVCTSWRSSVRERHRLPVPQAPWVLFRPLFETPRARTHDSFRFMRPSDGKVHDLGRPLSPGFQWKRFVGISPDGCVVLVNKRGDLRALNPLTGARLRLPRIDNIPKGCPKRCAKVVMSPPSATGPGPAVFMAFLRNPWQKSAVALARAGDKRWSLLDRGALGRIYDLAYHGGEFYVLGSMRAEDPGEEVLCIAVVGCGGHHLSSPPEVLVVCPKQPWEYTDHFLVGSASTGHLLLVFSSGYSEYRCCRLDLLPDGNGGRVARLEELVDLGDESLLLGSQCSMLVSSLQVPELRKNCIYSVQEGRQVIFKLDDGSIEAGSLGRCIEAAWFMPGVL